MTKIIPKIGWIQWQNPYDSEVVKNKEDKWEDSYSEEFDDNDEDSCPQNKRNMKVVFTPMGAIPLPEHSAPQKVFNLWMAHTNFNITHNVLNLVEQTDGVETVDVFTRYRMRVGIGKMFDTKNVIHNINQNLYTALAPKSGN